jgi:hypothetical protein
MAMSRCSRLLVMTGKCAASLANLLEVVFGPLKLGEGDSVRMRCVHIEEK